MDTPAYLDPALRVYMAEVNKSIAAEEARLVELQAYHEQLASTRELVADLPGKLVHRVSVPFGKHAFFPGELQHTNELTLHLGSRYYVQCAAQHAAGVLERRSAAVQRDMAAVRRQLDAHHARLQLSGAELNPGVEGAAEIRQSYEDSEALLASAPKPAAAVAGKQTSTIATSSTASDVRPAAHTTATNTAAQPPARMAAPQPASTKPKQATVMGDDEFAQLMARMDELEAQEEAARAAGELKDEDDQAGGEDEEEEGNVGSHASGVLQPEDLIGIGELLGASHSDRTSPSHLPTLLESVEEGEEEGEEEEAEDIAALFAPVMPATNTAEDGQDVLQSAASQPQCSLLQVQQDQQSRPSSGSPAAPASHTQSQSSSKPALRKGFLLGSSPSGKKGAPSAATDVAPERSADHAGTRTGHSSKPSPQPTATAAPLAAAAAAQLGSDRVVQEARQAAFSGTVLERSVEDAGGPVTSQPVSQASQGSQAAAPPRKVG